MISDGKTFDTNLFFSGGAGMFIEYHDIIKPVYLYAIIKMILTGETFGLPINIISTMSNLSIIEWYLNRRYRNPFKCLDYKHYLDDDQIDEMLYGYLLHDTSLYKLSPYLNTVKLFDVYRHEQMSFPIYIYSEREEPYIKIDCNSFLSGISFKYLYGDLKEAIKNCDNNFTYIFSNIDLIKSASEILKGTCSHILLADDYRYNYSGRKLKYDLLELAYNNPFIRTGTIDAVNLSTLAIAINNMQEEEY